MKKLLTASGAAFLVLTVTAAATLALTGCDWGVEDENYRYVTYLLNHTEETVGSTTTTTAFAYDEWGRKIGERQGVGTEGGLIYEDTDFQYVGLRMSCLRSYFGVSQTEPSRAERRVYTFDGSTGRQIKLEIYPPTTQPMPDALDTPIEGWERTNYATSSKIASYDHRDWNASNLAGVTKHIMVSYYDDARTKIHNMATMNIETGAVEKTEMYSEGFWDSNTLTETYEVLRSAYGPAGEITSESTAYIKHVYIRTNVRV